MEMLRNNHHISSRDTWHVTGAQCRVWPVSPSPHWPRSRPSVWCHPGSVTLWWYHLRWGHGHEVRTQEGVLPQVLRCDYISPLVLPSPCDTQKNQPCEQNIMKMWSCGLGCTEHYTKNHNCTLIPSPTQHLPRLPLHPPSHPGSRCQGQHCIANVHPGQDTETLHSGSRNAVFMHLRYFHI